jgi:hypothetical protein
MPKFRNRPPKAKLALDSPLVQHQVAQQLRDDFNVNTIPNKTVPRLARRRHRPFELLAYSYRPLIFLPR